mgnify:CR=1 FL=1
MQNKYLYMLDLDKRSIMYLPGVGPKTAKALMAQFKSVGAVKEATPDQLENTPGVGRQMAQTIYEYFHPQG